MVSEMYIRRRHLAHTLRVVRNAPQLGGILHARNAHGGGAATHRWPDRGPGTHRSSTSPTSSTMVSQAELEAAIHSKLGDIQTLFVSDVSGGCGQAYDVVIVSDQFEGKSTLQRHRLVNDRLKAEIASMHAFSQKTYTRQQFEELKSKYARTEASAPSAGAPMAEESTTTPTPAVPPLRMPLTPERSAVPEVTLTPALEMSSAFRSLSGTPSQSDYDMRMSDSLSTSRLYHTRISDPEFWLHIRQTLEAQLMGRQADADDMATDADVSSSRVRVPGQSEVSMLFEDFFLSQKHYLSANDIARIRDVTGMHGMHG